MTQKLTGKIAVVTGAGRGVGREIARSLAACGAQVALVARSTDQLQETERLIAENGGIACVIPADVSTQTGVELVRKNVEDRLGRTDMLINTAGVFGPIQMIKDSDPVRWIETLTINTVAPYLMCRAFMSGMIEAGWGRIVNVTSAAALHPPGPLNSAYGTSKVALNQFTRHLAAELINTGVTANVIHPGDVKTDMWAAIRDGANLLGAEADGYRAWVQRVDETGGDPPGKAADLILKLMGEESAEVSGRFLWIEDGLQAPIASWDTASDAQPGDDE
jgi:NAD(P)-dependent dehydrogenase (short-subunit alcohol dehydrogenase family)